MIITNKLLPVALIAALVGGSVGALVMHSRNQSTTAAETTVAQQDSNSYTTPASQVTANDQFVPAEFNTADEQTAYKVGFADGFRAAEAGTASSVAPATTVRERVVYRNVGRSSARSSSGYYAQQPRKRSFWQKHRDKLTVAMGTGAGAGIGALVGGKKGAAIGALAGAGGSALWTYKLRDRSRRY